MAVFDRATAGSAVTYEGVTPTHSPLAASLIEAAVAVGRMPGEAPLVLTATGKRTLWALLFRTRRPTPLADPRLEVLRAISASLARGVAEISVELAAAAGRAGCTPDDLNRTFPGVPMMRAGS